MSQKKQTKDVIIVKSDKLKIILRGNRKRRGGREAALERTASMPVACGNDYNQIDENKLLNKSDALSKELPTWIKRDCDHLRNKAASVIEIFYNQ